VLFRYPKKEDAVAFVVTKVLLVDDDPDLQEILQICLRQWGFEVASAANGDDGAAGPVLSSRHYTLRCYDARHIGHRLAEVPASRGLHVP
jgi:DNA-binding NtrC family response regulator